MMMMMMMKKNRYIGLLVMRRKCDGGPQFDYAAKSPSVRVKSFEMLPAHPRCFGLSDDRAAHDVIPHARLGRSWDIAVADACPLVCLVGHICDCS
jgi:hypothetical protein